MSFFIILFLSFTSFFEVNAQGVDSEIDFEHCAQRIYDDADFTTHYILQPESDSKSNQLKIAYYVRKGADPLSTPIVFFNGGPGVSSHDLALTMAKEETLKKNDLIFIDQRGTGCSSSYPELNQNNINNILNWGSRSIAKDAEAVRLTLYGHSKKWKVFGHSFGGLIALRYFSLFPRSISSMVIYGYSITKNPIDWLYNRIMHLDVLSKTYLSTNSYAADFYKINDPENGIRKRILDNTCLYKSESSYIQNVLNIEDPAKFEICGHEVIDSLVEGLVDISQWESLHNSIEMISRDLGTPREEGSMVSLGKSAFREYFAPNVVQSIAVNAISNFEIVPGYTPLQAFQEVEKLMTQNKVDRSKWLFDPIGFIKKINLGIRDLMFINLKTDPLDFELVVNTIKNHPDFKIDLIAGELDGVLPPSNFYEFKDAIGEQGNLQIIEGISHSQLQSKTIIQAISN